MDKRIMIVDDDTSFREEISELLSLCGYSTLSVSDGSSALEVARRMRHLPSTTHVPLIAVTGFYSKKEYDELMGLCGFEKCITKPFEIESLIGDIEAVLEKYTGGWDSERDAFAR